MLRDYNHFKLGAVFCSLILLSITPISAFEIEQNQHHYSTNNWAAYSIENNINTNQNSNSSTGAVDTEKQTINEDEAKKFLKEDQHSITSNTLFYVSYAVMIICTMAIIASIIGSMYVSGASPSQPVAGSSLEMIQRYEAAIIPFNKLKALCYLLGSTGTIGTILSGYILYA